MFVFAAIVLCLVAVLFACWPLLRKSKRAAAEPDHNEAIVALYKQRQAELQRELSRLGTDTAALQMQSQMQDELSAVLLSEHRDVPAKPSTARRGLGFAVSLCMPLLGVAIYLTVSDPTLSAIRGAEQVLTLPADELAPLQSWQTRLRQRVERAPDDSRSWYLLGHTELKLERYPQAAEAFATTNQLVPGDINVQIYWLQARYLASKGVLDEVGRDLAQQILAQQPSQSAVLEILALDAYQRSAFTEAVSLLNRALSSTQDIVKQASFAGAIKQVRAAMGDQAPQGVTVDVTTEGEPPKRATVFVIARPVGGGMPYAVVKRPALLLPFTVHLDDLVSMSPQRQLSSAEQFEVVVRLSESGTAMAAPQDWQWVSARLDRDTANAPLKALLAPPPAVVEGA